MRRKVIIFVMLSMYSLQIIHLALQWWLVKQAFILHGETADETIIYLKELPRWFLVLSDLSSDVNIILADCVLVR